jgi:hypothetical protein
MDARYAAFMGLGPERIPHWEHWSNPDAESELTGIDYYEHPRRCRQRMRELYPELGLRVPESDAPIERPELDLTGQSSDVNEDGRRCVRWGDSVTSHWDWGAEFQTAEDVLSFSPLENADFSGREVVEKRDYSSEEVIEAHYRERFGEGTSAPEGSSASVSFYNTMFMWPLLTFGWDLFLQTCLEPQFDRIMAEFAEINRRVFRVFARLPVNFVICHDDVVTSQGLVCSPAWMRKQIYPRYEEFWSILRDAGKEVIFMTDGRADPVADNVMACSARGIITEPYTDFKDLARRYEDPFLAGEGDNRVLMSGDPDAIERMVRSMVETAQMTGGYMMCIGNHIPWNVPAESIKRYFQLSRELAVR